MMSFGEPDPNKVHFLARLIRLYLENAITVSQELTSSNSTQQRIEMKVKKQDLKDVISMAYKLTRKSDLKAYLSLTVFLLAPPKPFVNSEISRTQPASQHTS